MEERIPIPQPNEILQPQPEPAAEDDAPGALVAVPVSSTGEEAEKEEWSDDEGELEFEFPLVSSRDSAAGTADELFADGRIRPFYPVFGRGVLGCAAALPAPAAAAVEPRVRGQLGRLFLEETLLARASSASSTASTSSSSSAGAADDDDGLDGAPPESYCVWRPAGRPSASASSPAPRKSGSTGSVARWRRISDLVVGRSHSDGKEKLVFFAAAPAPPPHTRTRTPTTAAVAAGGRNRKPPPPHAAAAAAYLANRCPPGGAARRTFLPYREELVGFFANVNGGAGRSHHAGHPPI